MGIFSDSRMNTQHIDGFSSISLKYRFLFGLKQDSRILIIGNYHHALLSDVKKHFSNVRFIMYAAELQHLSNRDKYDLICLDCYTDWGNPNIEQMILAARAVIDTCGILVMAATNRFSIDNAIAKIRRKPIPLRGHSPWGYEKILKRTGFGNIKKFLAFPTLQTPDEYIETEFGDMEFPSYISFVHKMLHWLRVYKYVHADYFYIASIQSISKLDMLIAYANKMMSDYIDPQNQLLLERFYLRSRGALLLLLSDRQKNYRVIIRIAVSDIVNAVISRNKAFTDKIHSLSVATPHITSLVPKTITTFEYRDCQVYVETRMPGILVWKRSRNQAIEKISHQESYEFIYNFNNATKQEVVVEANVFSDIIGNDLARIKHAFKESDDLVAVICNIQTQLYDYFIGKKLYVVWGHGDFGYGNILCNPKSGHIQGIIDWDTHVPRELPGVDFCNLLLQKESIDFNGKISPTLQKLQKMILRSGKLDVGIDGYGKNDFNLCVTDLQLYLCITALRFIKRSLPYSNEFETKKNDYMAILRIVNSTVEEILKTRHSISA